MFSQELLLADYEHKFIGKNQTLERFRTSHLETGTGSQRHHCSGYQDFFQEWLKHAETATS